MKKFLYVAVILFCSTVSYAQQHEFSIYGNAGLSTLQYKSIAGDRSNGIGGGAGIGYTFFFGPQWGLATGAEITLFNASVKSDRVDDVKRETYSFGTDAEEPLDFHTSYTGYEESQRTTYLQIPLMLQFQMEGRNKLYVAAGVKAGIALSGSYETTATSLTTFGVLPQTAQTFTNMPNRGFATLNNPDVSGDLDFGFNLSLSAEVGMRWRLGERLALYTGVYVDYGVLDISPEKSQAPLVGYQAASPSAFAYNSMLATARQTTNTDYTGKVNLFAAGVKLKLAFRSAVYTFRSAAR